MGDCLKFRVPGKPDVTVRVGDDMPDAVVEDGEAQTADTNDEQPMSA